MKTDSASSMNAQTGPRHPHTLLWVKILLGVAALGVVAWTVNNLRPPTLTPEQVASLDADARYARWKATPEAATFERLRKAGASAHADNKAIGDALIVLNKSGASQPDTAKALADAERLVRKHRGALDTVRRNLSAPFSSAPQRSMDEEFPAYPDFRMLTRLLMLEAELARRDGKPGRAARIGADGMRFGAQIMHGDFLIGRLVGHALQGHSRRLLRKTIPALSGGEARELVAALRQVERDIPPAAEVLAGEARMNQRTLLQLFGDRRVTGTPPNYLDKEVIRRLLFRSRRQVFADHTRAMEARQARADLPYDRIKDNLPIPSDVFSQIITPVYITARLKFVNERTQNALLLTQAALRAYEAEQGKYPASLDALVPRYLRSLPGDPYSENKPLRFTQGMKPLLYSIGPDERDDGGQPILNTVDPEGEPVPDREKRWTLSNSRGDIVAGVNL